MEGLLPRLEQQRVDDLLLVEIFREQQDEKVRAVGLGQRFVQRQGELGAEEILVVLASRKPNRGSVDTDTKTSSNRILNRSFNEDS